VGEDAAAVDEEPIISRRPFDGRRGRVPTLRRPLFERVREEKGLAYFVRSGRLTGLDAGMFYFIAGTQPGREAEVLAEIDAEVARVQRGEIEAAELARCLARLKAARRAADRIGMAFQQRRRGRWR
jgi:predicted Zn-dependent peptidase